MTVILLIFFCFGCIGFIYVKDTLKFFKEGNYSKAFTGVLFSLFFWVIGFSMFAFTLSDDTRGERLTITGYVENIEALGETGDRIITINGEQLKDADFDQSITIGGYYTIQYWPSSKIITDVERKEEHP